MNHFWIHSDTDNSVRRYWFSWSDLYQQLETRWSCPFAIRNRKKNANSGHMSLNILPWNMCKKFWIEDQLRNTLWLQIAIDLGPWQKQNYLIQTFCKDIQSYSRLIKSYTLGPFGCEIELLPGYADCWKLALSVCHKALIKCDHHCPFKRSLWHQLS